MPIKKNDAATPRPLAAVKKTAAPKRHRKAATAPEAIAAFSITHEEISRLAYSYWAARGFHGGSPEADWQRAERELRARLAAV
jgi:hypothetical protein